MTKLLQILNYGLKNQLKNFKRYFLVMKNLIKKAEKNTDTVMPGLLI